MTGPEKKTRRHLTINEKLAIVEEYDRTEIGQRGQMCRRHGVAPAMVMRWRKQKAEGLLTAADPEKKQSRVVLTRAERVEYEQQKRRIADLEARLARSESAVEILGKASALLESLTRGAQADQDHLDQERDQPPPPGGQRYYR
jgi:transposase